MTNHLEDAVAKTAATAAAWHAKIKALEIQIADWTNTVTVATKTREGHALAAALGESAAVAAVKKARADQHEAEQHLADLSIALPAAREQLANAERAATTARHELAKHRGEKKMRDRVAAAARMDEALAACAAAFDDFQRLGAELQNDPDLNLAQGSGMARWENAEGLNRLAMALPAFMKKLPPASTLAFIRLAQSESQFWSLAPEQPAKAA